MANKSKLQNLPLSGEVCHNLNKLDIVSPGDNKFLEINGPVYGNTLTPIYKKSSDNDYEYYDKDKNPYNISNAALRKSNTNLLTFNNVAFKEEELEEQNIDSLYKDGNDIHYTQINTTSFSYDGHSFSYNEEDLSIVLKTRIIGKNEIVVFGINKNGDYVIRFYYYIASSSMPGWDYEQTVVTPSNVGAPIITHYHQSENVSFISVITDSGSNASGDAYTFYLGQSYSAWHQISLEATNSTSTSEYIETAVPFEDILEYVEWVGTDKGYEFCKCKGRIKEDFWKDHSKTLQDIETRFLELNNSNTVSPDVLLQMSEEDFDNVRDWVSFNDESKWSSTTTKLTALYNSSKTYYDQKRGWPQLTREDTEKVAGLIELKFKGTSTSNPQVTQDIIFRFIPNVTTDNVNEQNTAFNNLNGNNLYYYNNGEWVPFGRDYITYGKYIPTSYNDTPCNAILDNGTLICLKTPEVEEDGITLSTGRYAFTGNFESFNLDDYKLYYSFNEMSAVLVGSYSSVAAYPYKFVTQVFSLTKDWFRSSLITLGGDEETKTQILYDTGYNKVLINPGFNTSTYTNGKGSVAEKNSWRILFNNNYISGLSWHTPGSDIGTLLTDWNSVQDVLYLDEDNLFYINNAGKTIHISLETISNGNKNPYQIILDRFILINTTSYWNCWDIQENKKVHWASDYNNRFQEGVEVSEFLYQNEANTKMLLEARDSFVDAFVDASAQNANYEITNSPIVSYCLSMEVLSNVYVDKYNRLLSNSPDKVDYYRGVSETTASYDISFKNGIEYKDVALESAVYPVDSVLYNPNIFSTFIKTYNQRDMVFNEANSTAYPLLKYNGQMIMAYYLTNGLENVENMFVIQTLHYMVSRGYIYEVYYDGDTVSQYQAVLPVDGLEYLGCLPTEALFWCQRDRSIYTFAGDAIMRRAFQWNEVDGIKWTKYFPNTQELFISTNVGLTCISNGYQYRINVNADDIWAFNDSYIIKEYQRRSHDGQVVSGDFDIEYRYNWSNGFTGSLFIKTPFLGSLENQKIHFDCFYIRLFKDHSVEDYSEFKIKSITMTDMGMEASEKTFTLHDSDFDEVTDTIYLRFQQQYQSAVGTSYEITSPYPIVSMVLGYTEMNENAQIAHVNI